MNVYRIDFATQPHNARTRFWVDAPNVLLGAIVGLWRVRRRYGRNHRGNRFDSFTITRDVVA